MYCNKALFFGGIVSWTLEMDIDHLKSNSAENNQSKAILAVKHHHKTTGERVRKEESTLRYRIIESQNVCSYKYKKHKHTWNNPVLLNSDMFHPRIHFGFHITFHKRHEHNRALTNVWFSICYTMGHKPQRSCNSAQRGTRKAWNFLKWKWL